MTLNISITQEELLHQLKISLKIPELVKEIIGRKIIEKTVKEANLEISNEDLQKTADQFRVNQNLYSADETIAWLNKYGLSVDDFEQMIYNTYCYTRLKSIFFGVKAEPWFFEHQLDYASAVLYEITLTDEDLAMELFYSIKAGEISFYDAAHQYIEQDLELRRRGGYRGQVYRQEMKPEISAAVFCANPPEVLKPIITAKGVYLILVEEIIRPQLNDNLRFQIGEKLFHEWLKREIEDAFYYLEL